jgi:hypothetical protein
LVLQLKIRPQLKRLLNSRQPLSLVRLQRILLPLLTKQQLIKPLSLALERKIKRFLSLLHNSKRQISLVLMLLIPLL